MDDIDSNSLKNIGEIQNIIGSQAGGDNLLMLSIIFGVIGMVYFSYGKKRDGKEMFMYSGMGLMVFPYLVDTQSMTLLVGFLLTALPFFLKA